MEYFILNIYVQSVLERDGASLNSLWYKEMH